MGVDVGLVHRSCLLGLAHALVSVPVNPTPPIPFIYALGTVSLGNPDTFHLETFEGSLEVPPANLVGISGGSVEGSH